MGVLHTRTMGVTYRWARGIPKPEGEEHRIRLRYGLLPEGDRESDGAGGTRGRPTLKLLETVLGRPSPPLVFFDRNHSRG